jgi:NAD(P)-dependent dehydrogenase (short-subunit alcohol dehydrogenase family)
MRLHHGLATLKLSAAPESRATGVISTAATDQEGEGPMDPFSYESRRVIVTGCSSGMGEATTRLLLERGAEVHGIDINPTETALASFHMCDLRDFEAIEATVASIAGPFDSLFNCAGLPQTFPALDVMKVNFIGMRHLTQCVISKMEPGSAVTTISSTAGFGYLARLPTVLEFVNTRDEQSALAWCESHQDVIAEGYQFSKEAIIVWTMALSNPLIKQGIRINCTSPGPTSTAMMPHFEKAMGRQFMESFPRPIGRNATPEEQALPLLFLNSKAASYVTGHNLEVDGGFIGGVLTGHVDVSTLMSGK